MFKPRRKRCIGNCVTKFQKVFLSFTQKKGKEIVRKIAPDTFPF